MSERVLASRFLLIQDKSGSTKPVQIDVGLPYATEQGEHCCEVDTGGVLFNGKRKVFGVDAIDAVDYAIQLIDLECSLLEEGTLLWPDGTRYLRVPNSEKMSW